MKKLLYVFLFIFYCTKSFGQTSDLKVILHEDMINKLLKVLGNFSGTADYKVWLFKGTYKWTVMNAHIKLKPGKADYICDVKVEAGPFDYQTAVLGDAAISYNEKTNLINTKIAKGVFEVYTVIFGHKFHITDIDLADYYKEPITFDGPLTMGTSYEFTLPDNSKKTIYIIPVKCELKVEEKIVVVNCEVEFSETVPKN